MSRSRRKAIIKDGGFGSEYWRTVRRVQKQSLQKIPKNIEITFMDADDKLIEELNVEIPHNRQIINDWDFCDYKIDWEYDNTPTGLLSKNDIEKQTKIFRRK